MTAKVTKFSKVRDSCQSGHKPGFAQLLNDLDINVIISGGGCRAIDIFNAHEIEGLQVQPTVEEVVKAYLAGDLESTGSVCHDHQHHDECH